MPESNDPARGATVVCPHCHGAIHVSPDDRHRDELTCDGCGAHRPLPDLEELFDLPDDPANVGEAPSLGPPAVSEFPRRA